MGRGDSNAVSVWEALVLWVVLLLAVVRWSKPAPADPDRDQAASLPVLSTNTR